MAVNQVNPKCGLRGVECRVRNRHDNTHRGVSVLGVVRGT